MSETKQLFGLKLMRKIMNETQNKDLKQLFEMFYENGDKKIEMLGVPQHIREAYKEYYAMRKENG
mgnify:CR=1 FL=1